MTSPRWAAAVGTLAATVALMVAGPAVPSARAAVPSPGAAPSAAPGPIPVLPLPGRPAPPDQDAFYRAPDSLGSYRPGDVIRSRPVTVLGPTALASVSAYQLLYRTTDATGDPIATVTTLLLPSVPTPGRRPLVSYHTAEDSLTVRCSPSYTLRTNSGSTQPLESGLIAALLGHGWDVSVPDYEGPHSEWTVGRLAGQAALDGVRAVERFRPAGLDGDDTPVGMIGYSGGSIPTIWADALAHDYAPELNLVGVAAGGIAANLQDNLSAVDGTAFFGTAVGALTAIDRAYPDGELRSVLNARGRALSDRDGRDEDGCAGSVVNAPFGRISQYTNYPDADALLAVPEVKETLDELNLITGPTLNAPAFLFNEIHDELTIIKPVDDLVEANCADGATIDYRRDPVGEHLTGAGNYVAPALAYLGDRFAGRTAPNTCPAQE
jgi:hypothetical protein